MAVNIKKMVDAICSLTVLELCKLVKALRDKFGLRTPDTIRPDINGKGEATKPGEDSPTPNPENVPVPDPPVSTEDNKEDEPDDEDEPIDVEGANEVAKEPPEVSKETIKKEQGFNPDLTDYDSNWAPTNQKPNNRSYPSPPKPKGEDYDLVYAWRYSDNKRYAKIGRSTKHLLHTRMPVTYYPTGDPVLIGIRKCKNLQHAEDLQNHILDGLKRTRPDREWVEIDEAFHEMIDLSFIKGEPE